MRSRSGRVGPRVLVSLLLAAFVAAQEAPRDDPGEPGDADRAFDSARPLVVVFVGEPWWNESRRHFAASLRPGKVVTIRKGDRWYVLPGKFIGGISRSLAANPDFKSADLAGLVEEMREKDVPGLSLAGCSSIRDDDLRLLARVPKLRHLVLGGGWEPPLITAEGLTHLQALEELETLDLAGLSSFVFAPSPLLARLGIEGVRDGGKRDGVTDEQLQPLNLLGSLREVDLSLCPRITAKALAHLKGLKNLHTLRLRGTNLGDDAIAEIARFAGKITDLSLACTPITDESLPVLAALRHLTRLDITGCVHLTDAGLMSLAASESLRQVVVNCPRRWGYRHEYEHISRAGLKALARAMPRCEILD